MKSFNIEDYLQKIYNNADVTPKQPIIGVTTNFENGDATLRDRYYKQVENAGGVPVLLPPTDDVSILSNAIDHIDGLLLTGGGDYNPLWTNEQPIPQLHGINAARDAHELMLAKLAFNRQLPILGICRGMQTIAIALGGKVRQDIGTNGLKHSQDAERSEPTHSVTLSDDSLLRRIYGTERIFVNSFHHQAVGETGSHLRIAAVAPDEVIEAVESSEEKPILGIQWHAEWLGDDGLLLFKWLAKEAILFKKAKALHQQIITLDSHCDTPMFFPQGIRFDQRDPRILYDIHKMTEGRIDAVTMAAYLPQPKNGETFASIAPLPAHTPKEYATIIFDKIDEIVKTMPHRVALAASPAEILRNKQDGKKSIVLAIENGLALENDLQNVSLFANRGVTYITLCHNGDNQICDSARGNRTYHGLSDFGHQIVTEMNKHGVMVDLSHASEESFYDALASSQTPIVCSHSSCRTLCDHPRNLTDEQMRKLAQRGGVMQITLYAGFLQKDGNATVLHALEHLKHAIKIMGIEHVGIGTDFDGDGGVSGFADASECVRFTCHLLRRAYNDDDIQRIWGGNWLRLMGEIQDYAKQHA